jgi:hypothetical protein
VGADDQFEVVLRQLGRAVAQLCLCGRRAVVLLDDQSILVDGQAQRALTLTYIGVDKPQLERPKLTTHVNHTMHPCVAETK